MYIQPHDVEHEFPEFKQTLEEMKSQDSHLAQLVEEYEQLNAEIVDIEENEKPFQDFEFEEMKKRRLKLKDEIYLQVGHAQRHGRALSAGDDCCLETLACPDAYPSAVVHCGSTPVVVDRRSNR